jgi:hypothetical protein
VNSSHKGIHFHIYVVIAAEVILTLSQHAIPEFNAGFYSVNNYIQENLNFIAKIKY